MKRSLFLGMVMGLVFSLVLPFHSMAANVNIQTRDGYAIGINKPYITLFTDGSGNVIITLDAVKDEVLPLTQFEPLIKITGTGTNNLSGIVTATIGTAVTFDVEGVDSATATTPGATVVLSYLGTESQSPFTPGASSNKGTFTKTYTAAGNYAVSFGAVTSIPGQGAGVGDSTVRTIQVAVTDPQACMSTVTATVANPAGGSINAPTSVATTCGSAVSFSGTIASGYTGATVTEGSFSPAGLTWNWTNITAPTTNGATKPVSITFTGSTSCSSSVTATIVGGVGGSITSTNPVTTNCSNNQVSFSGTFASGYTGGSATEGTFTPNGLYWSLTNITAPSTNNGTKTVNVTLTTGSTPPPVGGWLSLNNRIGNTSFFGYNYVLGGADFQAVGGTAYQFLIDPIAAGATTSGKPLVSVADRSQTYACNSITLSVLDDNNNKIASIAMSGGNASYNSIYPKTFVYRGQRLLLEFTPSHSMPMLIYWSMN
jgi:hypothetical protein